MPKTAANIEYDKKNVNPCGSVSRKTLIRIANVEVELEVKN
jgi:hypothetical protein